MYEVEYVFASDEYNEFDSTVHDDVFGIFVNGVNIAIPTNNPSSIVSVANLNGRLTPNEFRSNDPFNETSGAQINPANPTAVKFDTEYDGLSVPLTASYKLSPNVEYEFSFAIADVMDNTVDSGVFLSNATLQNTTTVPSPFLLMGVATAYGWSRKMRNRMSSGVSVATRPTILKKTR